MPLGGLLEMSWGVFFDALGVFWRHRWRPGGLLEASWKPLGGLLELLKMPGQPRGGFWGLMGRYWRPLEALLGASWSSLGQF